MNSKQIKIIFALTLLLQNSILLANDFDFEMRKNGYYIQPVSTNGYGCYRVGLQFLTMQREYYVLESKKFTFPYNNSTIIGIPFTFGVTNYIDLLAKFYYYHDARSYLNESDIFSYFGPSESGIGTSYLGLKFKFPLNYRNRFQIGGVIGALLGTSKNQIDGMQYRWTRTENDYDISLLESIDIIPSVSIQFGQGYIYSGSNIFNDQVLITSGIDIHPYRKISFSLDIHNFTFLGRSPESVIKSIEEPFQYWKDYEYIGNPRFIYDNRADYNEDFFVLIPSLNYQLNNSITLNTGAVINIADQIGPHEGVQFVFCISYNGKLNFLIDSDSDGIKDNRDMEPESPLGYPVDNHGVSLDSDRDGVPDGRDKQFLTPFGATVDYHGTGIDSDNDGIYDGIDKEPDSPPGSTVDRLGVSIDTDNDGVPNGIDKEPNTPRGYPVDQYGVAMDSDGDGVPDGIDIEPNTPRGKRVDDNGVSID